MNVIFPACILQLFMYLTSDLKYIIKDISTQSVNTNTHKGKEFSSAIIWLYAPSHKFNACFLTAMLSQTCLPHHQKKKRKTKEGQ